MRHRALVSSCLVMPLVCACLAGLGAAEAPGRGSAVLARYAEIPKGVVLEGVAEGMDELKSVTYDKDKNEFTINETMKYKNPVSRREFAQILKALCMDDCMGMTLMEGQPRVYGPLAPNGEIVKRMIETDKMLGGILYGFDWLLEGVKLPGDYKPKRAAKRSIPVVAFSRFTNFVFEKSQAYYKLVSCNLDVQLIPLAEKKTATGGHLPDMEKVKEYVMEPEDRENIDHLKTHQSEYLEIPAFAKSAAAGEAAAFARLIRDSKIDTDALLKQF